jgi:hypothetical protein
MHIPLRGSVSVQFCFCMVVYTTGINYSLFVWLMLQIQEEQIENGWLFIQVTGSNWHGYID